MILLQKRHRVVKWVTHDCPGIRTGTGTRQFTRSVLMFLPLLSRFAVAHSLPLSELPRVPAPAWALGTGFASLPNSITDSLFSPQRLRQLVTPDPSLPQPKPHLHLEGGPGRDGSPSPRKGGLMVGEKETHL